MKKVLISIFLLSILILPTTVWALPTTLVELGNVVISAFWTVTTVIAVCCFILSGIYFATASGDPQKILLSKAALKWGAVGAVVAILSGSILPIILRWLS